MAASGGTSGGTSGWTSGAKPVVVASGGSHWWDQCWRWAEAPPAPELFILSSSSFVSSRRGWLVGWSSTSQVNERHSTM